MVLKNVKWFEEIFDCPFLIISKSNWRLEIRTIDECMDYVKNQARFYFPIGWIVNFVVDETVSGKNFIMEY